MIPRPSVGEYGRFWRDCMSIASYYNSSHTYQSVAWHYKTLLLFTLLKYWNFTLPNGISHPVLKLWTRAFQIRILRKKAPKNVTTSKHTCPACRIPFVLLCLRGNKTLQPLTLGCIERWLHCMSYTPHSTQSHSLCYTHTPFEVLHTHFV